MGGVTPGASTSVKLSDRQHGFSPAYGESARRRGRGCALHLAHGRSTRRRHQVASVNQARRRRKRISRRGVADGRKVRASHRPRGSRAFRCVSLLRRASRRSHGSLQQPGVAVRERRADLLLFAEPVLPGGDAAVRDVAQRPLRFPCCAALRVAPIVRICLRGSPGRTDGSEHRSDSSCEDAVVHLHECQRLHIQRHAFVDEGVNSHRETISRSRWRG